MVNILVHTYTECCDAFASAQHNADPLILSVPHNAVRYMGLLYLHTMLKEAEKRYPQVKYTFICDCGDDASLVQEAFRLGFLCVGYTGSALIAEKLRDIAAQYGGELLHSH